MQPQQNFGSPGAGEQFCAQCGSPMPKEMRFCRSCGNRLGEGPAEYTETVRLPGATAPQRGGQTTPFYPTFNAPMTTVNPAGCRRRLGWKGTTWLWIALVLIFGMGGLMSLARKGRIPRPPIVVSVNRSWVGVDSFTTTDNGVTFRTTDIPGGPADNAGLVGGDVITSFDGIKVRTSNEIMDLLTKTPIGKQVEVVYLRDGISRTTQLSTISRDEYNRLQNEFDGRPEGKGMFGFERDKMQRVNNFESKTFGVQINYIEPNGPADLFGIQKGDIITDFDKIPIRTPDEFLSRVRRAVPRSVVEIKLLRNGQPMVIPVTMGSAGR
jgi:membrane-associated protease RseP (regulator of RpoE activity)